MSFFSEAAQVCKGSAQVQYEGTESQAAHCCQDRTEDIRGNKTFDT